ncbi:hypothetical protein [Pararobbsia silviterrae]|uniref:DUF4148 domain-containing protein n=1 Tax=Pararobbsia silviterrae TaxID=1792498 RepID=A0A494Y7N7_9BURK|nr:hypothetical protein [Pararobbsia silviterrae]RKP58711.1 hypothetical protein D7S86_01870 [Pararobbsia silviterrae]
MSRRVWIGARGALAIALAAIGAISIAGCATNDPVWQRNQAELKQLEACGYVPKAFDPYYPEDLQRAEARAERGECGTH